jgi:hypothetical protein
LRPAGTTRQELCPDLWNAAGMERVPAVLGRQALNRATLARQLLLRRAQLPVPDALERLVGLQAQAPDAPYVGLWSRLADFDAGQLASLIEAKDAVRVPLMRATMHLVTAADCAALRRWVQPVLAQSFASQHFARQLHGVDLDAVIAAARVLLTDGQLTRPELGAALAKLWPARDPTSLAYAVTYLLPVVQVPPRGIWGKRGPVRWTAAEAWIGSPGAEPPAPDELVMRYFTAFGPASVRDAQAWSGLTRLQEVVDRLGSRLCRFRDETGRELLDLPGGPRPEPGTPAPPRFLPEYDNVLLSYADRGRIVTGDRPIPLPPGNGGARGTVLVDGFFRGTWHATRSAGKATLRIEAFDRLSGPDRQDTVAEGARLLGFIAPQLDPDVILVPAAVRG